MLTEMKERRPPLDTDAAAVYTGTKPNYLEKLRCNGDGPVFIKRNGLVRYDPDDLDAWLEAGKQTSTSDKGDAQYALVLGDRIVTTKFGAKSELANTSFDPAGFTPTIGDSQFFQCRSDRQHRVRLASAAEIKVSEHLVGGPIQIPAHYRAFVAVRNTVPGVFERALAVAPEDSETDLDEATAAAIFERVAGVFA